MRRLLIPVMVLLSSVAVFAVASERGPGTDCTHVGSSADDVLAGGREDDVICARGGKDYVAGNGGRDILRGGKGPDTLVGGNERDRLFGKKGNDRLFLVDGHPGGLADGGPGNDLCFVDQGDRVRACEDVHRGGSLEAVMVLSGSFHGALELADLLISEPPTIPPPTVTITVPGSTVTVTQTVTVTVTAPPCNDGPPDPPPFC